MTSARISDSELALVLKALQAGETITTGGSRCHSTLGGHQADPHDQAERNAD